MVRQVYCQRQYTDAPQSNTSCLRFAMKANTRRLSKGCTNAGLGSIVSLARFVRLLAQTRVGQLRFFWTPAACLLLLHFLAELLVFRIACSSAYTLFAGSAC